VLSLAKKKLERTFINANPGTPYPKYSRALAVNFTSSDDGGGAQYWTMHCLPTSSIMFSSPDVTSSLFDGTFGQDIEFISVYSLSSSIDVEYVVVNA